PISSLLITPLLLAYSRSDLPTCCRRDGKHHCGTPANDQVPAFRNLQPRCPLFPKPNAVPAKSSLAIVAIRSKVAPADRVQLGIQLPSCGSVQKVAPGAERKRGPPPVFS